MSNILKVGDIAVTKTYNSKIIEYCTYEGKEGAVLQKMNSQTKYNNERYVKKTESLPYSVKVFKQPSAEKLAEIYRDVYFYNESMKEAK